LGLWVSVNVFFFFYPFCPFQVNGTAQWRRNEFESKDHQLFGSTSRPTIIIVVLVSAFVMVGFLFALLILTVSPALQPFLKVGHVAPMPQWRRHHQHRIKLADVIHSAFTAVTFVISDTIRYSTFSLACLITYRIRINK